MKICPFLFVLISFLFISPALMQDEPLEPITAKNAGRLTELQTIGSGDIDQISLSPDGTQLAVINRLGIHIHDLTQPDAPIRTIAAEYAPIINARFNPDWTQVAISVPGTIFVLEVATGSENIHFGDTSGSIIHSTANEMQFSSDGNLLSVTRGMDTGDATVWNILTGELVFEAYHRYMVGSPIFSPDNKTFAYVYYEICTLDCASTQMNFWFVNSLSDSEVVSGDFIQQIPFWGFSVPEYWIEPTTTTPFDTSVRYMIPNHDGSLLITNPQSAETHLWDVIKGKKILTLPEYLRFILFSPNNDLLVFDERLQGLCLFDLETQLCRFIIESEPNVDAAFNGTGTKLAITDASRLIRLIDTETTSEIALISGSYLGSINEQVFSADGSTLYFMDGGVNLRRLDIASGEITRIVYEPLASGQLAYDPVNSIIALGMQDGSIQFLETESELKHIMDGDHTTKISSLAFSMDGVLLASASSEFITILNIQSGETLRIATEASIVDELIFSSDGTQLLAIDQDSLLGTVIFDAATGTKIVSLPDGYNYGDRIQQNLVIVNPYEISVWKNGHFDMQFLQQAEQRRRTYLFRVNHAGDALLTFGSDIYIGIMNMLEVRETLTGEIVAQYENHLSPFSHISFSPDGRLMLLGGADGTIRVWGVPED